MTTMPSSFGPDKIDAFCNWIRDQPDLFEEMDLSEKGQIFRFKVKSRRRRTGIIAKRFDKFIFVGAAGYHFSRFAETWGPSVSNGERDHNVL
jgi:hypothetical protein